MNEQDKLFRTLRIGVIVFLTIYIITLLIKAMIIFFIIGTIYNFSEFGEQIMAQNGTGEDSGWKAELNTTHFEELGINETIGDCLFTDNCVNVEK